MAKTKHEVVELLGRSRADRDFPVVILDGSPFGDHLLVVALGIDAAESEACCRSLRSDLIEHGLVVEHARLFVIDAGKALCRAVRLEFGNWALIQRGRIHKLRNALEHLQGPLQRVARNLKRWCRQRALRWGATGIQLAERRFRRIKGYKEMPLLIRAIDAAAGKTITDNKKKIAQNMPAICGQP